MALLDNFAFLLRFSSSRLLCFHACRTPSTCSTELTGLETQRAVWLQDCMAAWLELLNLLCWMCCSKCSFCLSRFCLSWFFLQRGCLWMFSALYLLLTAFWLNRGKMANISQVFTCHRRTFVNVVLNLQFVSVFYYWTLQARLWSQFPSLQRHGARLSQCLGKISFWRIICLPWCDDSPSVKELKRSQKGLLCKMFPGPNAVCIKVLENSARVPEK